MRRKIMSGLFYAVITFSLTLGLFSGVQAATGNINPTHKWAWGTNIGWVNFAPSHGGVTVYADHLEGYAWAENVGWIHFKGEAYNVVGPVVAGIPASHFIYLPLIVR